MKNIAIKDNKNRNEVKNAEINRYVNKLLQANLKLPYPLRWSSKYNLINFSRKSSVSYLSNRCVLSKTRKSFTKYSKFSRTVFLNLVRNGFISGFKKSSW